VLHWLHVFVTELATLYLVRRNRSFDVAAEALGADYAGALTRDGWAPYDRFVLAQHGQCNAHLLRRCDQLLQTATRGAVNFPRQVKALLREALAVRDARDTGQLSLRQSCARATRFSDRLAALCGPKTHAGNERLASFLDFHIGEVFNYLRCPALDATNWRAEQAIRPAVVNRKVWGGNRTPAGAQAQGVLASVLRTAAQRGLQALDFLSATLRAPAGRAPRLIAPAPP
jgi:transposase